MARINLLEPGEPDQGATLVLPDKVTFPFLVQYHGQYYQRHGDQYDVPLFHQRYGWPYYRVAVVNVDGWREEHP